jgi:4-hydroxythreonine-4-phosphate dehydrogenase
MRLEGPIAPDTCFLRALDAPDTVVVAMYHDQGHIPVKLIARDSAVNVTLGLPFVRTSVDHGTAHDIAGQGRADTAPMTAALDTAMSLVEARRRAADR